MVGHDDLKELRDSLPESKRDKFMDVIDNLRAPNREDKETVTDTDNNGSDGDLITWVCRRCEHEFQLEIEESPPYECDGCGKSSNKTVLETEDPPFKYFDYEGSRETFIPTDLADDILSDYNFVVHKKSEDIYYYKDGIYKNSAEGIISEMVDKRLGRKAKNNYVNETIGRVRNHYKIRKDPEEFEGSEDTIVLDNGVLNVKTRELRDYDPDDIHLSKIPVKYDPEADCPEIKKFIRSLVADEGDVKKIQEMIGYSLLQSNPLNKAFMGLGPGGNGRSTLFELLDNFFGADNTASVDLSELIYDKYASADLYGKMVNFCADISDKKIKHSGRFKKLVGEDKIRAQEKYKQSFNFKNYATPWFSANELPQTTDKTRSFFRRWIILNFPYTFTSDPEELSKEGYKQKDPSLPEALMTDEELSGLLNFALDGLDRVLERNKFTKERSIKEKRRLWERESDPVIEFLEDWCIIEEGAQVHKDIVRQAFHKFCLKNGYNVLSPAPLTKKLKTNGVATSRPRDEDNNRYCAYKGISLKPEIIEKYDLVEVVRGKPYYSNTMSEGISHMIKEKCAPSDQTDHQNIEDYDKKSSDGFKNQVIDLLRDNGKSDIDDIIEKIDGYSEDQIIDGIIDLKETGYLIEAERGYYELS